MGAQYGGGKTGIFVMTEKEALNEIISRKKWYHIFNYEEEQERLPKEAQLRMAALRILNGTAKEQTKREFFNRFGYDVEINVVKRS